MNRLNNPTEIAGCILWLDGADKASMRQNYNDVGANVSDGNQVGYWGDKSGNLPVTNFTNWQTTKRPTYVESVSSLRFASVFSTSLSALGNLSNLNPTTIFIVTAPHLYTTNAPLFNTAVAGAPAGTGANAYIPFYITGTGGSVATNAGGAVTGSVNFTALSSFHLLVNRNTQATNGLFNNINGSPSTAGSYTTQVARTCFKIGCGITNGTTGGDDGNLYSGYIAEIIIYNSSLDSVNYTRVSNYLNNKWNPVQYIPKQIFSLKSGNWSDTGLWSTSAYSAPFNQPLSGDTVYTNSFTVTADSSTKVNTITNPSLVPNINAGGSFVLANGVSLSANVAGGVGPYTLTLNPAATATLVGNLTAAGNLSNVSCLSTSAFSNLIIYGECRHLNIGGGITNNSAIYNRNQSKVTIIGNVIASGFRGSYGSNILYNGLSSTAYVIGNVVGGGESGIAIHNVESSTVYVTGNVIGGPHSHGGPAIYLTNGTVYVTGPVWGNYGSGIYNSGGSAYVLGSVGSLAPTFTIDIASIAAGITNLNSSTCLVSVTGDVVSNNAVQGIISTTLANLSVYGNIINAPNGRQAIYAPRYQVFPAGLPTYTKHAVNGYDKFVYYYTGNTVFVPPLSTNVLQVVTYNFGALTGAMIVPAITAVNAGVKVGTEIGSAYLSVSDFWNEPLSAIQINSNTIGEYMKKTLTVNSLSSVLNSLDFSKL